MVKLIAKIKGFCVEEDQYGRIQLRVESLPSPSFFLEEDEAEALFVTLDIWLVSKGR